MHAIVGGVGEEGGGGGCIGAEQGATAAGGHGVGDGGSRPPMQATSRWGNPVQEGKGRVGGEMGGGGGGGVRPGCWRMCHHGRLP